MSSSIISTLAFTQQQIILYTGIPILIAGLLGGLFNVVVFLSLQTFRQSPCAFYLTVLSFVNIGNLLLGLLSRVMISGFLVDWTRDSLFYCKFRNVCLQVCTLISLTCMCLAAIDQFLATCSHPRWQQWSNIKLAHRLTAMFTILWILHQIPFLVYYDHIVSPITGGITCAITDAVLQHYSTYFAILVLTGVGPIFISTVFGFMTHRNVQQLAYRTIPLVRRELDKQLTGMVLVQVVCTCISMIPLVLMNVIVLNTSTVKDPVIIAEIQFANLISYMMFYMYLASPFYIYVCVSQRFRQQFIYVMFEVHLKRWRRQLTGIAPNQVLPQP